MANDKLINEIRELATDEIYALTRKSGQPRFTVKDAVRKVPRLRKYVTAAKRRPLKAFDNESMANAGLNGVLAALLQELARQGGLKVNVNLTIYLKKNRAIVRYQDHCNVTKNHFTISLGSSGMLGSSDRSLSCVELATNRSIPCETGRIRSCKFI